MRTLLEATLFTVVKEPRGESNLLHRRAQLAVLTGPVRGDDVEDIVAAVAPSYVAGRFSPDVALLDLAVTALELATPPARRRSSTTASASAFCRRSSSAAGSSTATASTPSTRPPVDAADWSRTCSGTPAGGRSRSGSTRRTPSSSTHGRPPSGRASHLQRSPDRSPDATRWTSPTPAERGGHYWNRRGRSTRPPPGAADRRL